ncbi:hypothetical protein V1525DRAFT_390891 [Lipomyces kononenkoae]|uniref:Uncharacterized protein n=1 Tax=Lipomyces kononenkoae TaxID=34357 RepID=A0ACC3STR7_LIPKO
MAKKVSANVPPNGAHAIDNIPNAIIRHNWNFRCFHAGCHFLPEGDGVSTLAKLKASYDSQDAFIEALSSFMEEEDNHGYSEEKAD